ncbi:phosphatidate cytidylyltransferase [Virgibacillus dakarensis]|uniref:Phosphatidate cytidylyltransferase n=1 Tax=Lentibacillus populi TaxID=1827502 RepID=A0A9W5TUL1_9BACI|nr:MULTISPECIES: phosphatidate cytidylyltransferase [Bacillaceae]MBT2216641.1 phosphatidate cytidylyltransferase [Virgibacillus dakarensis]MTW84948.1 phosphatidate cytidylyltransferase [Virgibacillus dakarensis]GGB30587.1 phosphatidate cytidylyltransferase [Lentibacillus populi]
MKQRILTAIFALIIFVPFVLYGNLPFTLFVYLLATIGLLELIQMRKREHYGAPAILAIIYVWTILWEYENDSIPLIGLDKTEVTVLFVVLLLTYIVFIKNKFNFDDAGFLLLSAIYIGMGFFSMIVARGDGPNYIFYVLLVIWATDTGAYFIGKAFGKNKLWPKISPNKTIEGALGGVILACAVGVSFQLAAPFPYTMGAMIGITILVSVFGQIGDLVESAFKRHYGVKDSGKLLPGHGGILDRLDSLLFVLPILYLIGFI